MDCASESFVALCAHIQISLLLLSCCAVDIILFLLISALVLMISQMCFSKTKCATPHNIYINRKSFMWIEKINRSQCHINIYFSLSPSAFVCVWIHKWVNACTFRQPATSEDVENEKTERLKSNINGCLVVHKWNNTASSCRINAIFKLLCLCVRACKLVCLCF